VKAYCQAPERLARVEEALRRLTGKPIALRVESAGGAAPEAPAPAVAAPEGKAAGPKRNPKEDAEKVPLIKRALEVFGTTVHRVDEGFGSPPDREALGRNGPGERDTEPGA
jgi:hypothetical protein